MAVPTLIDIMKVNAGAGFEIIEENILNCPELRVIPADVMLGTEMKLTVRTDLPSVAFRKLNSGTPRSKSKYEERIFQCADFSHQCAVDIALVNKAADKARLLDNHMSGVIESAFRLAAKQFWYGVDNDSNGFPGVIAQMLADADHEIDATGAAAKSSVFFVRVARESLQFITGNGTTFQIKKDWKLETIYDEANNPYQAMVNWLNGAIGCRMANKNSVVRIKNLGTATGKKLTDDLMFQAYEKFVTNLGAEPTHIFMTPRSQEQLRASRTNTGSNEKGTPVPMPSDWNGIPIIKTSAISNAETI